MFFKTVFREFKEFALKSSFIEVAIGIFIGAGLTPVAISLIKDIVMPVVGYFLGDFDFVDFFIVLRDGTKAGPYLTLADAKKAGAVTVNYGIFINTALSFLVISWVAFGVVKGVNRVKRATEESATTDDPTTKVCQYCLTVVPIKAKKCSACTSDLPEESNSDEL